MQGQPFLGRDLPAERAYVYGARDRMDERYDIIRTVQGREVLNLAGFLRLAQESNRREDDLVRLVFRRGTILDVTVLRPREKQ